MFESSEKMVNNTLLKRSSKKQRLKRDLIYLCLSLPAIIVLLLFHYVPLSGIVIAFKDYNYRDGIFGSSWVGFDNFKFLFKSVDGVRILRNTIGYSLASMFLINLIGGMIVALLLYEVTSKRLNKLYQTSMLIPSFISFTAITYIVYLLLNPELGLLNQILNSFNIESVNWYNEAKYWPIILMIVHIWRDIGMAALYYYAALLSIDKSLFEAAELDGAGKWKQIWYVSVPELLPMASMVVISKMGSILSSSFDLYYQVPMNSGALYPATDVISTYVYRGLIGGNIGSGSAVGLFQSAVGLVLIIVTNAIIKKIDPNKAMF
ncbi:MAG: sugar ABC transporter permease [Clostridia bacterium]|nr:sugar ABC transporter permease [Clostridia bacterium]